MQSATNEHYFYFQVGRSAISFKEIDSPNECSVGEVCFLFSGGGSPPGLFKIYGDKEDSVVWKTALRFLHSQAVAVEHVVIIARTCREVQYENCATHRVVTLAYY